MVSTLPGALESSAAESARSAPAEVKRAARARVADALGEALTDIAAYIHG